MRWEMLFSDLEAEWEARIQRDLEVEIAEAVRLERSQLLMADRLRHHMGGDPVELVLRGGQQVSLQLSTVGADWLAGRSGAFSAIVPLGAVVAVDDLRLRAQMEPSASRRALGIGAPLRALVRDREQATIVADYGDIARGMLVSAGRDHLDIVQASEGSFPGERSRRSQRRTVPISAIIMIRSLGSVA